MFFVFKMAAIFAEHFVILHNRKNILLSKRTKQTLKRKDYWNVPQDKVFVCKTAATNFYSQKLTVKYLSRWWNLYLSAKILHNVETCVVDKFLLFQGSCEWKIQYLKQKKIETNKCVYI